MALSISTGSQASCLMNGLVSCLARELGLGEGRLGERAAGAVPDLPGVEKPTPCSLAPRERALYLRGLCEQLSGRAHYGG